MANWSNIRLIAVGPQREITCLRAMAKPFLALARKRWRSLSDPPPTASEPVPLFSADMIYGECGPLFEEPVKRFANGILRIEYRCQTRYDEVAHFCEVSKRFPRLRFLVIWADPISDCVGSAYVRNGQAGSYEMGANRRTTLYRRARRRWGAADEQANDGDDSYFWAALSDMMDAAERRWRAYVSAQAAEGRGLI